ncbi:MAG: GNAT family N-acetyltransferase, partial [Acidobacteriota bacterium]|nr:GNAT family N-acetyltransferase [Acidobacteriota bacterium]
PVGSAEASLWIDTMIEGFLHPDRSDGPPAHEAFDRDVLARAYEVFGDVPGVERVLASHGGATAGGASMCFRDGIALLCGAATLPALRRRGVQSALLRARLARAREGGCELAVVTTQPGSKSQQNVQRSGFELLYTRAILVWDPRSFLRTAD